MKLKAVFTLLVCVFILAAASLWFAACASGDGSRGERGLAVENIDIDVFPQLGHSGKINSLSFSPDGKYIVSGCQDSTAKIWDIEGNRELRTILRDGRIVRSSTPGSNDDLAVFSADGKRITVGENGAISIYDVESGHKLKSLSLVGNYSIERVAISPNKNRIVAVTGILGIAGKTIRIWDIESGRELNSFSGHNQQIFTIEVSPDEKYIASGSADNTIKIYDAESGRELRTLSGHTGSVYSVSYSPGGKYIASGSTDKTIKIWDAESGRELRTLSGNRYDINSVAFIPDGSRIVSGSEDGTKIWDVESGKELILHRRLPWQNSTVYRGWEVDTVTYSQDGMFIAASSRDGTIRIWEAESGREWRTFSGNYNIVSSEFATNEKYIATFVNNKTIIWDIESGIPIRTFGYRISTYSPDGKHTLSVVRNNNDVTIRISDAETGELLRVFEHPNKINNVISQDTVKYSPDGRFIAYGSDNNITIWDLERGVLLRTLTGHKNRVRSVMYSPNGRRIVSGSLDGTVKIWDTENGRELKNLRLTNNQVFSVAYSPDGKHIIAGSNDKYIKIWDAESGREIKTLQGERGSVHSVSYSQDGKRILVGFYDGIIWVLDTGNYELQQFTAHQNNLTSVNFSSDRKEIISRAYDGTTRLWDASTFQEIAQFISFSGADTQLAAASRGLTVETETTATTIEGEWLSITPDGYYQASPRGDRYINVRVNNTVSGIDAYRSIFYNPDVVQARLQGRPDPASKANVTIQQAASFTPPEVAIQSPANFTTTNTATTNLSVAITSQSQPVKNIKILVNGRLIGRDELAAVKGSGLQAERASLTVTGNQKTVNFNLPLELEPGVNRIEVVAFNGYSENRRFIDVTRNAQAGERPPLPNLWVVAVGVNGYDNAGPRLGGMTSLNFAVADAKGLIDSLKAQEGKRYAKVNAMLIADGERLVPTTENIRQGFKFLEGADPRRDVVVLFLAGHGISGQGGQFYFLPKDAAMNTDKVVDASRAISGDEIMGVLDAPGNRLVFIDACQSGGVDNDRMVRSLMDTNAFVFAASRGNEFSYEDARLGHGYFTYSIMTALGGASAALVEGRNVSVLSMSGFVKDDVPKRTGGRQNPSAYSLGFYDFPMAVIKE